MSLVTGKSDGGLDAYLAKLQALANGDWKAPVAEAAGAACNELVKQGFTDGKAPDGTAWAPTKAGNSPPLTRTGTMAASPEATASGDGFELTVADPAIYHQATRPMLPEDDLPPAYSEAIQGAFKTHLEEVFGS